MAGLSLRLRPSTYWLGSVGQLETARKDNCDNESTTAHRPVGRRKAAMCTRGDHQPSDPSAVSHAATCVDKGGVIRPAFA